MSKHFSSFLDIFKSVMHEIIKNLLILIVSLLLVKGFLITNRAIFFFSRE